MEWNKGEDAEGDEGGVSKNEAGMNTMQTNPFYLAFTSAVNENDPQYVNVGSVKFEQSCMRVKISLLVELLANYDECRFSIYRHLSMRTTQSIRIYFSS